jgi:apolipoprotein N-acyltransferase
MQHFSASVFRAVENGIWYIRVGNTGYTTIIDPYGRIRKDMPILIKDSTTGDIDFSFNRDTVFYYVGDLFLYMVMGFLGACLAWSAAGIVRERIT